MSGRPSDSPSATERLFFDALESCEGCQRDVREWMNALRDREHTLLGNLLPRQERMQVLQLKAERLGKLIERIREEQRLPQGIAYQLIEEADELLEAIPVLQQGLAGIPMDHDAPSPLSERKAALLEKWWDMKRGAQRLEGETTTLRSSFDRDTEIAREWKAQVDASRAELATMLRTVCERAPATERSLAPLREKVDRSDSINQAVLNDVWGTLKYFQSLFR